MVLINSASFMMGAHSTALVGWPLAAIEVASPFLSAYFAVQWSCATDTHKNSPSEKRIRRSRDDAARGAAWLLGAACEKLRRVYVEYPEKGVQNGKSLQDVQGAGGVCGAVSPTHVTAADAAELLADLTLVSARLLTQILQHAIGGNAKTWMVATVRDVM